MHGSKVDDVEPGLQPIDRVGPVDMQAVCGGEVECCAGAGEAVCLIGPDIGEHAQAMFGIGGVDRIEVAAGTCLHS